MKAETVPASARGIGIVELGVAIALAVAAIAARLVFLAHGGPLWRDEVTSVNIGAAGSLRATLGLIHLDSFPALWALVLHSWIALGLGGSDLGLRVLGVLLGCVAVAAACWAVVRLGARVPLLTLALLAMTPTSIVWGSEVRGYALGLAALLLLMPAFWMLVRSPSRASIAAAAVTALLAVHSSFSSSILLFCVSSAAAAVALRNRSYRTVGLIAAIGVACAVTMLAYLPMFASIREWNIVVQRPVEVSAIFRKLGDAVGGVTMSAVWGVLLVAAVAWCVSSLVKGRRGDGDPSDLALFLLVASVTTSIAYLAYVASLKVPTQTWYYLPMMGLLVVFLEVTIDRAVRDSGRARAARVAVALAAVAILAKDIGRAVQTRMTNLDLVAEELRVRARPEDLILLSPWYDGVSFHRYYGGAAPWVTLPDFEERRYQLYRELKRKMTERDPNRAVLDRIAKTMEAGHRIWLVGALPYLREGQQPESLEPAPDPQVGWTEGAYEWTWLRQAAYVIQTRAAGLATIPVRIEGPANGFENLPLYAVANANP